MMGQVMGARLTTATRRSVIFNSPGLELVLTFCGRASRVSSSAKPAPKAPVAPRKNDRREFIGTLLLTKRHVYHMVRFRFAPALNWNQMAARLWVFLPVSLTAIVWAIIARQFSFFPLLAGLLLWTVLEYLM